MAPKTALARQKTTSRVISLLGVAFALIPPRDARNATTDEEKETRGANNPLDAQTRCGKTRGEKPPKEARFPVYLYFITKRMRYFASVAGKCARVQRERDSYTRANVLRTVHRCLADHPHGYFTAASAVSPWRKVPNGERRDLKKDRERTSGVVSRFEEIIFYDCGSV